MSLVAKWKNRMKELGISPTKMLGQNFLVSQEIIDKIVGKATSQEASEWIEIGPGLGALTDHLLEAENKLFVIEFDKKLAEYWRSRGLEVHEGDALRISWEDLNIADGACLVSNLPYQISSSIVIDRSINPCGIEFMVLMFQKEVAQRLLAEPSSPDYGMLSVVAQYFWEIDKVCDAGPKDFYPPPKVASRVMYFKRKKNLSANAEYFLKVVKASFSQRRKMLAKNLSSLGTINAVSARELLVSLGHKETVRAEELSFSDFEKLANKLK